MRRSITFLSLAIIVLIISVYSCDSNKNSGENTTTTLSNDSLIRKGEYLVAIMGCDDCHSPKKMGPNGLELDMALRLSGYPSQRPLPPIDTNVLKNGWVTLTGDLTGAVGPWGASFAANITSDETGIGNWTEEQFKKTITQGKWKGMDNSRTLLPPMPWQNYRNLKQEDLSAIFAFLKSTKPVKNVEPPVQPLSDL